MFDTASNILSPGSPDGAIQTLPDNRLRSYQDLSFEYDPHGNLIRRTQAHPSLAHHSDTQLSWDAAHQLSRAQVSRHGVTQTTHYRYDALGRRISKTDAFGSTHYLWDGHLLLQSQRASQPTALFIHEPNSFVPLATVQHGQTFWYQCDQIGAPLELTDVQGRVAWAADYKVWGEAKVWQGLRTGTDDLAMGWSLAQAQGRGPTPPLEQPFRFQGQQFDEETGLHYSRFRYYDPVVGRFVSQDPIGLAGGINTFQYAPNPVVWIDPLGLMGERPPNLTPPGAGRRGAFRAAKRNSEIPMCACPITKPATDKRGNRIPGRDYEYDQGTIRDHSGGHKFPDDPTQNRGPHINDISGEHYDY